MVQVEILSNFCLFVGKNEKDVLKLNEKIDVFNTFLIIKVNSLAAKIYFMEPTRLWDNRPTIIVQWCTTQGFENILQCQFSSMRTAEKVCSFLYNQFAA